MAIIAKEATSIGYIRHGDFSLADDSGQPPIQLAYLSCTSKYFLQEAKAVRVGRKETDARLLANGLVRVEWGLSWIGFFEVLPDRWSGLRHRATEHSHF